MAERIYDQYNNHIGHVEEYGSGYKTFDEYHNHTGYVEGYGSGWKVYDEYHNDTGHIELNGSVQNFYDSDRNNSSHSNENDSSPSYSSRSSSDGCLTTIFTWVIGITFWAIALSLLLNGYNSKKNSVYGAKEPPGLTVEGPAEAVEEPTEEAYSEIYVDNISVTTYEGDLLQKDEFDMYDLAATVDGTYRIEARCVFVGTTSLSAPWANVHVLEQNNELVASDIGNQYPGVTLKNVKAGDIYKIKIEQNASAFNYKMYVFRQKETIDVTNHTVIHDTLDFIEQNNIYLFTASQKGDVVITVADLGFNGYVKENVIVQITDINENEISSNICENNDKITISNVEKGDCYYVSVLQNKGQSSYRLILE